MLRKVTIFGERCSGTNYLQKLLLKNFDIELVWNYGWKHWPGHNSLENSDDVLFICIVRNPIDWLNSFWEKHHEVPKELLENLDNFLNNEFWSIHPKGHEIIEDRNIYTKERYKNIFEMRHIKNKFFIDDLPKKVKNYILIRYEDLLNDYESILNRLKEKGLKTLEEYPINITKRVTPMQKEKEDFIVKKRNLITFKMIKDKIILDYERKLRYLN